MNRSIVFNRTGDDGNPIFLGRVTLLDSGEVQLSDMSDNLRTTLESGVEGLPSDGLVLPKDGIKFLRGCLFQFRGSYLRATVELPAIPGIPEAPNAQA